MPTLYNRVGFKDFTQLQSGMLQPDFILWIDTLSYLKHDFVVQGSIYALSYYIQICIFKRK